MSIPLLIDCDPGIDDAFALALAAASPELDLVGVTTVTGNVPVAQTTANALAVLNLCARADVPVAAGAARALVRRSPGHPAVHGPDGLGGVRLPAPHRRPEPSHAVAFLGAVLERAAEPVTVAAIGPLTNLALLCALRPDVLGQIERLVVMGATVGPGNMTPVAEFNVWADPEAAYRVLSDSGDGELAICLVGLDVTRQATLTEHELERLGNSPVGARLVEMTAGYGDHGATGPSLHDALALAAILDPSLLTTVPAEVDVDTGPGPGRGQTICATAGMPPAGWGGVTGQLTAPPPPPARLQLATGLDAERFRALVADRLGG